MHDAPSRQARLRPVPGTPDADDLREAALRHLARYASTAAGLGRVLDRRVMRWVRAAAPAPEQVAAAMAAVRQVIERLTASGALDDAAFAEGRAHSLARAGRSRRAIAAHLAARGVGSALTQAVMPEDPEHDLAAALILARRRRLGPFRTEAVADPAQRRRELAALARGGVSEALARLALGMDREAAEALLIRRRRDR